MVKSRIQTRRTKKRDRKTIASGKQNSNGLSKKARDLWSIRSKHPQGGPSRSLIPRLDYIFDGQVLHRDLPDYQLCDIHDRLIRQYLDDPENRQTKKCTVRIVIML